MKNNILLRVFIAIFLAVVAGYLAGPDKTLFGVTYLKIFDLIGRLFLNALTLVMVPLVASSIITGTARLGSEHSFGVVGRNTFGYFILTSALAILTGMLLLNILEPGKLADQSKLLTSGTQTAIDKMVNLGPQGMFGKLEQILFELIPSNILAVATQGKLLGLIFFSILFGYFISKIDSEPSKTLKNFWQGIFQVMMRITHLVMLAMPIGVFGLVAKVVASTGAEAVKPLAAFFGTTLLALLVYALIILPLLLFFVAKVNPITHFKAVMPALVTAFSTSSTAATLPITFESMEVRAKVPNRICSFVLPLGTSINLSGTALYCAAVVIFISQVYGGDLSLPTQIVIFIMTLITSMGMAGIPSASLIAIMAILQTVGLSAEGIALILPVERFLDMFRTTTNVLTNTCSTVLVARSEKTEA